MKTFSIVRAMAAAAAMAFALVVGADAQTGSGKIDIIGGDTYNWGAVAPGKLTAQIKVKNIGETDLQILEVKPSCGCTSTGIDDSLLAPGEVGTISVTLDVTSRTGPVEKSLTVHSTDGATPYRFIRLQADVKRSLTVAPSTYFVVANATQGVEIAASPLQITNTGSATFTLFPPELASGNVKARFEMTGPVELHPGESMQLSMWVTPNDANTLYGSITMKTTNSENELLQLGLTGTMSVAAPPQSVVPAPPSAAPEVSPVGHR